MPANEELIKLYVMDGGSIEISDMSDFSRTGKLDGEALVLANPSYLIRHPRGDLIWDTGNADALADFPEGMPNGVYLTKMKTRLVDQLSQLGLSPSDIEYLSLSHVHPDHSGNANVFAEAIFIVNELEYDYMFSAEVNAVFGDSYSELASAKTQIFNDTYDVFGDGTVTMISTPGHTPGSTVLLVRLRNAGKILLTGDLYAHAKARELQTIPTFNVDPNATMISRREFETIAAEENARVIIQHSKADYDSMPVLPDYLD